MWLALVQYLESHPKNKGQWYGRVSTDFQQHTVTNTHIDFTDNYHGVTFEKLFIMMRNIVSTPYPSQFLNFDGLQICHEHSFYWKDTVRMGELAFEYFGSAGAVEEAMKLYFVTVVKQSMYLSCLLKYNLFFNHS